VESHDGGAAVGASVIGKADWTERSIRIPGAWASVDLDREVKELLNASQSMGMPDTVRSRRDEDASGTDGSGSTGSASTHF